MASIADGRTVEHHAKLFCQSKPQFVLVRFLTTDYPSVDDERELAGIQVDAERNLGIKRGIGKIAPPHPRARSMTCKRLLDDLARWLSGKADPHDWWR
ncbi:hypothetical protein ABIC33_000673 [Variovorax sp. 1140]|uniref:hypothetical protein n=1 Tax=Variovorax atrisoli TaxID=3394203 RepID=UPI0033954932